MKVLHRRGAESLVARESLLSEASLMAQFDNDNVVRLIGVVTVGDPMLVVLEYCELGSLESFLINDADVGAAVQLKVAIDCAKGMEYLASLRFVHRDLASRNVLLDSTMAAKIGDFGLSRERDETKGYYSSHGGALPIRWTAPEALESSKFTEKSDVWSFGILLHEIWTKAILPYNGMTNDKVWVKVMEGYRLPCPLGCPGEIYSIMKSCWQDAVLRPTFAELVKIISTLSEQWQSTLESGGFVTMPKQRSNASDIYDESSVVSPTFRPSQEFTVSYVVPDKAMKMPRSSSQESTIADDGPGDGQTTRRSSNFSTQEPRLIGNAGYSFGSERYSNADMKMSRSNKVLTLDPPPPLTPVSQFG